MPLFGTTSGAGTDPQPGDQNLLGWTFDPAVVTTGTILPTAGGLTVARIKVVPGVTITNILFHFTAAGVTLTAGQNFAGLYSAAGALLAATADQSTNWQSGGLRTMPLTAPQAAPGPYVYAGWYANGTTLPTMTRGANVSSAVTNAGLSAPNLRYATADTGLTTALPSTLGAQTGTGTAYWVGVS